MRKELEKVYNPKEIEQSTYDFWLGGGYFTAKIDEKKQPYTIVIPPPKISSRILRTIFISEALKTAVNTVLDVILAVDLSHPAKV